MKSRVAVGIDRAPQRHVGVRPRYSRRACSRPRPVKAPRSAAAKVGVEPRQYLARLDLLPVAHLDRAHDRGLPRLHQYRRHLRDRHAVHSHDLVDRDQPHCRDHHNDEAGDDPHRAARRARDRRIDDRRRRPLKFEDRRQGRVSPTPLPYSHRIGRRFAHDLLAFLIATDEARGGAARAAAVEVAVLLRPARAVHLSERPAGGDFNQMPANTMPNQRQEGVDRPGFEEAVPFSGYPVE